MALFPDLVCGYGQCLKCFHQFKHWHEEVRISKSHLGFEFVFPDFISFVPGTLVGVFAYWVFNLNQLLNYRVILCLNLVHPHHLISMPSQEPLKILETRYCKNVSSAI